MKGFREFLVFKVIFQSVKCPFRSTTESSCLNKLVSNVNFAQYLTVIRRSNKSSLHSPYVHTVLNLTAEISIHIFFNETSQSLEYYSAQMQAVTSE